ncbi:MAG: alpha-amylase family protein [Armatimonadota bacterium]|jgi:hypothetical protein
MSASSRIRRSQPLSRPAGAWRAACVLLVVAAVCLPVGHASAESRRAPMVFMAGLQGAGAVETIKAINETSPILNTVYYDLPEDAPDELESIREHIEEAAAADLKVIVGLRTCLDNTRRISARNPQYETGVRSWVGAVIGGLAGTEGIAAWATDHSLERDISHTDEDFREFLLERHGSLEALNARWGTNLRSLQAITRESADALDDEEPHGVGPPTIDVAEYQRRAYHDVMAMWAREIRRFDPDTPLMTGRVSLYRSLAAIPESYDIVQPHLPPDLLEPDLGTHNVQGVQIARMGGKFDVIPWLRIPLPPSEAYAAGALEGWVLEAGLRGAVGVGLEDWSRIAGTGAWRSRTLGSLSSALEQRPFDGEHPRPTAAVIYEPYAGGHEFFGAPAWGYATDFPVRDLAQLAWNYRLGTIFGGLDYLTMRQVAEADLRAYSVVFMPTCLSVPQAAASALMSYVEGGGAVFADLGLGMYEARSWMPTSSPLAVLFGIAGALEPADRVGTYRVGESHPAFPSVRHGMEAQGTFVIGEGVERSVGSVTQERFEGAATASKSYAFQGPSWFVRPSSGTIPLATQSVRHDQEQNPFFLGLTVNSVGAGLAVFTPFAAWSYWPPADALHEAVHCDLMARRARYRLLSNRLVEPAVGLSGSDDRLRLLRRRGEGQVEVLAGTADHRAYLGTTGLFSAEARTSRGARSGVVRLAVDLPAGAMRDCEAIPLRLRPAEGHCRARVAAYAPGLIMLEIGGTGSVWGRERRGMPERFYGGARTQIRFSIDDGLYPVAPGSRHQVTLMEGREHSNATMVTADHRGRLDFWLTTAGARVEIAPSEQ